MDKNGALLWQKCLGGTNGEAAYSIIQTADSGYLVGGETYSDDGDVTYNHGGIDGWVVKLAKDTVKDTATAVAGIAPPPGMQVYPTVNDGTVHIRMPQGYQHAQVRVYDLLGVQRSVTATRWLTDWTVQLNDAPDGLYLLQVTADGYKYNYRIVIKR